MSAKKSHIELYSWMTALALLALMNPATDMGFSLCIFKNLGINFCPGCGIGHSISYFLHGQIPASLQAHPLGIPALIIIVKRIVQLARPLFIIYLK